MYVHPIWQNRWQHTKARFGYDWQSKERGERAGRSLHAPSAPNPNPENMCSMATTDTSRLNERLKIREVETYSSHRSYQSEAGNESHLC